MADLAIGRWRGLTDILALTRVSDVFNVDTAVGTSVELHEPLPGYYCMAATITPVFVSTVGSYDGTQGQITAGNNPTKDNYLAATVAPVQALFIPGTRNRSTVVNLSRVSPVVALIDLETPLSVAVAVRGTGTGMTCLVRFATQLWAAPIASLVP